MAKMVLMNERDLLHALLVNSPDYIFFKDRQSRFIVTNDAHARLLLGLNNAQEAIGKTDFDLFKREEAQRFYDEEQRIMETGQPMIAREWLLHSSTTSKEVWLSEHKLPMRDETGQVIGLLGVARDTTERRQMEEALRQAHAELERRVEERTAELAQVNANLKAEINERKHAEEEIRRLNQELEQRVVERTVLLEAANKELDAFAFSVSHDLRAPLRHIDGFIEMLQKGMKITLDDQSQHYMEVIADSARKMGTLIDDLLSFSRMGRTEMFKSKVDLDELVQDIVHEFWLEAEGRDIQWDISPLPLVTGDQAMLRLALVNLISNALKFTRPRKTAQIEIGCKIKNETEVIIFARDNGVGFDMKYVDKLFGVFQRLHRADEFEGTGIGLANVRRIINRHGGRTWAEGEVDHGATFYFSLPQPDQQGA